MVKRHRLQISSPTVGWAVAALLVVGSNSNNSISNWYDSTTIASAFSIDTSTASRARTRGGKPLPIHVPSSQISSRLLHALPTVTDSHHRIIGESTGTSSTGSLTSTTSSSKKSNRSDRSYTSSSVSTTGSSSSQLSAFALAPLSLSETEVSTMRLPYSSQSTVIDKESIQTWWSGTLLPIVSCALLITGNTVGAGCLVLPELAVGPGLLSITIMYIMAYLCNVISGCILADVAITQKERMTDHRDTNQQLPTSLNDFATMNFESSLAGNVVASISLFVNSCVMAFDLNRFGSVLGSNGIGVFKRMLHVYVYFENASRNICTNKNMATV